MITKNDLKSEFGVIYVQAIATAAGFYTETAGRFVDSDGVDIEILSHGTAGVIRSPRLHIQVKATQNLDSGDEVTVDLGVKNYNELCDPGFQVPRILVIAHVPVKQADWLFHQAASVLLQYQCYWRSLRGQSPSDNEATQRVFISAEARFDIASLRGIMEKIGQGRPL